MLSQKIEKALNAQLNAELYSAYLYFSMSAYFESKALKGFAHWMRVQAQEEMVHAVKFYNYINERGGRVAVTAIQGPPTDWKAPVDVFAHTYAHEQKVTGLINDIASLALEEKDHVTGTMLQWFLNEQIEEESTASGLHQQLVLIGDTRGPLLMLDRELAQRVFVPPPGMGGAPAAQPGP